MTLTTHTTSATRRPVARRTAPARPRRGPDHRRLLGPPAGRQRHARPWPTSSTGWSGRAGLGNFDLAAAGELPDGRRGREFSDSEVYKYLEAMAWEIGRTGDAALEARFRALVARVAAAQEPDGYLNTNFGRPGQAPRWSDLEWGHELYCLGHLFQAAVARERTRPDADDGLLGRRPRAGRLVSRRSSGTGGIESICGHAEIEVGLAELARVTGERRYLAPGRVVRRAARRRHAGDIEWGRSYFQDDISGARRSRPARPCRARELSGRRRGRRGRRDRTTRPCSPR